MPWLDKLLHKNPIVGFFSKQKKVSPVLKFALDLIDERKKERQDPEKQGQGRDFLDQFLDIKDSNPSIPDV